MSNKTRSTLKLLAVILVILAVLMHFSIVVIPALAIYNFWLVITGFVLLLISSK